MTIHIGFSLFTLMTSPVLRFCSVDSRDEFPGRQDPGISTQSPSVRSPTMFTPRSSTGTGGSGWPDSSMRSIRRFHITICELFNHGLRSDRRFIFRAWPTIFPGDVGGGHRGGAASIERVRSSRRFPRTLKFRVCCQRCLQPFSCFGSLTQADEWECQAICRPTVRCLIINRNQRDHLSEVRFRGHVIPRLVERSPALVEGLDFVRCSVRSRHF